MRLDPDAARRAVATSVAVPMKMSVEEAAAGMYRVACNNMAQGVREVTIKRGYDPREFPFIAAGGAGPIHSCLICNELEIPLQIVPRSSSVLCAFGMLLSDLQHDFVRTVVSRLDALDWERIVGIVADMRRAGDAALDEEGTDAAHRRYVVRFDCRYIKQYHEVSFAVADSAFAARNADAVAAAFHREHNRLYGYSLEAEKTPVELINIRLQAIGATSAPRWAEERNEGKDASRAYKRERAIYIPETMKFAQVPIFDGHLLRAGNSIIGPAMIETVTTATFVSAGYDCLVDRYGSLVLYRKGREDLVKGCVAAEMTEMAEMTK
jgi:N-methylhydantoinase A